jgi:hypothetical protein
MEPGEVVSFTRSNGTFHRSFDEAFAVSDRALYHYRRPILRRARWTRLPIADFRSTELREAGPALGATLACSTLTIAVLWATVAHERSSPMAWVVVLLTSYIPYLAYKSGQDRLKLTIKFRSGTYSITAPLDGYKDETAHDNALLQELYRIVSGFNTGCRSA